MAATYGVDLDLMAEKSASVIPGHVFRDAEGVLAWAKRNRRTLGLPDQVYTVCEALKVLWRNAHPEVETMWGAYETAARNAIQNPGVEFPAYRVSFSRIGNWLRIRLPSGRYLCYPSPKVEGNKISYMGVNVYAKKWHRIYTYGGKLAENIDQAVSRDVMAAAMPRAEAAGYPIVLTVHDELNTECPDRPEFDDKALSKLLSTNPDWAPGLPLAAKGFTTYRYKKS
jgi:DNA polymerase